MCCFQNILCRVGIECAVFRIFYVGLEHFVSCWNRMCCFQNILCRFGTFCVVLE